MARRYDAIVVGLGAMGSAAVDHLSRRGLNVVGIDRYSPPHHQGSSHGHTRLIREAYFEHPAYVPLVQRAYAGWADLGRFANRFASRSLLLQAGAVMIGTAQSAVVQGALLSANAHGLAYEKLTANELHNRFPALRVGQDMVGVWEPRAGLLSVEACIQAQLDRASSHGATLICDEPVKKWSASANNVLVETPHNQFTADHLVLTAGAWLGALASDLNLPLQVERQVMFWFEPKANPELLGPERLPPFLVEYGPGQYVYVFPNVGHGLKAALHHQGDATTADTVDREVKAEEESHLRTLIERFAPDANGKLLDAQVCLYTNTPDDHFVLDQHPHHPNVMVVSPCSGHGFKFAPVIGEIVAQRLSGEAPRFDLDLFKLDRLRSA